MSLIKVARDFIHRVLCTGSVALFLALGFTANAQAGWVQEISAGVTDISTGWVHRCALVNGALQCSGSNYYGQIGNGQVTTLNVPYTTIFSTGVTAVAGGHTHTCAIVDGAVQCWGSNSQGQLGLGSGVMSANTPTTVIPSGATSIAAGQTHTCAIVNGAVQCWGYNIFGQIGDGTTTNRYTPFTVITAGVTAVAGGDSHSCAIVGGLLQCWGYSAAFGPVNGMILHPVTVLPAASAIGLSFGTTRAIVNGTLQC